MKAAAPMADSRVEILLDEPQGTISPNIYGHFMEHLGGVIYDGLWVGPRSKVPNVDGLRRDVIEHMKKIQAPVVPISGRLLCRQLRLARWNWSAGEAAATHKFLERSGQRQIAGHSQI
jgi:alpha-L-arabinofuranosidase